MWKLQGIVLVILLGLLSSFLVNCQMNDLTATTGFQNGDSSNDGIADLWDSLPVSVKSLFETPTPSPRSVRTSTTTSKVNSTSNSTGTNATSSRTPKKSSSTRTPMPAPPMEDIPIEPFWEDPGSSSSNSSSNTSSHSSSGALNPTALICIIIVVVLCILCSVIIVACFMRHKKKEERSNSSFYQIPTSSNATMSQYHPTASTSVSSSSIGNQPRHPTSASSTTLANGTHYSKSSSLSNGTHYPTNSSSSSSKSNHYPPTSPPSKPNNYPIPSSSSSSISNRYAPTSPTNGKQKPYYLPISSSSKLNGPATLSSNKSSGTKKSQDQAMYNNYSDSIYSSDQSYHPHISTTPASALHEKINDMKARKFYLENHEIDEIEYYPNATTVITNSYPDRWNSKIMNDIYPDTSSLSPVRDDEVIVSKNSCHETVGNNNYVVGNDDDDDDDDEIVVVHDDEVVVGKDNDIVGKDDDDDDEIVYDDYYDTTTTTSRGDMADNIYDVDNIGHNDTISWNENWYNNQGSLTSSIPNNNNNNRESGNYKSSRKSSIDRINRINLTRYSNNEVPQINTLGRRSMEKEEVFLDVPSSTLHYYKSNSNTTNTPHNNTDTNNNSRFYLNERENTLDMDDEEEIFHDYDVDDDFSKDIEMVWNSNLQRMKEPNEDGRFDDADEDRGVDIDEIRGWTTEVEL